MTRTEMPETSAVEDRRLADCPLVLLIVYTPGAEAVARGYEPWLVRVDNPYFNAIPGIHHYANWKIDRVLRGGPLPYTYFDFQGIASEADLERVWFNRDLDSFRREWIRLWGYGAPEPPPVQRNVYLMRPAVLPRDRRGRFARILGGRGAPPDGADAAWRVEETVRKHFAIPGGVDRWRVPAAEDNPLGLDWLALSYGGDSAAFEAADVPDAATVAFTASLIAAPDMDRTPG